jgi:hypothetical protein
MAFRHRTYSQVLRATLFGMVFADPPYAETNGAVLIHTYKLSGVGTELCLWKTLGGHSKVKARPRPGGWMGLGQRSCRAMHTVTAL